jgi:hypothetical protein
MYPAGGGCTCADVLRGHAGFRDKLAEPARCSLQLPGVASFEPGEDWFYDYEKRTMVLGVEDRAMKKVFRRSAAFCSDWTRRWRYSRWKTSALVLISSDNVPSSAKA